MSDDELRDAAISFRVKASLKARLEALARRDKRRLSQYIELVLEEHAEKAEEKTPRRK